MVTEQTDGSTRMDSERLDWLTSKALRSSAYMWLPTLYCWELPDLRAAIDAAMAFKPED